MGKTSTTVRAARYARSRLSLNTSDLRLRRLDKGDYQRCVELELADESWMGAPVKLRAETELFEDGCLVVEIRTETEARDVEIGGVALTGGPIASRASAALSPDEARALAAALSEQADFLAEYRAEIGTT